MLSSSARQDASMMFGADADRRPVVLAVGGVEEHAGHRPGRPGTVEDAHLEVGEVDPLPAPGRRR